MESRYQDRWSGPMLADYCFSLIIFNQHVPIVLKQVLDTKISAKSLSNISAHARNTGGRQIQTNTCMQVRYIGVTCAYDMGGVTGRRLFRS